MDYGLQLHALRTFERTKSRLLPGMVIESSKSTQVQVTSPSLFSRLNPSHKSKFAKKLKKLKKVLYFKTLIYYTTQQIEIFGIRMG